MRTIRWDQGTLLLEGFAPEELPEEAVLDPRVRLPRAPGIAYHRVVLNLHQRKIPWADEARAYAPLQRPYRTGRLPRDYQNEAVDAWRQAGRRGVVVLPTGAGKSLVAELCIRDADRSALIVAPTLELVAQWYAQLERAFGGPIGLLGGGQHEVHPITVATYDSAWLHVGRYGNRFGLLVFDECHHLPSAAYSQAASAAIAPFRLGLSATPERPDGAHADLTGLIGPIVYRREITELAGEFLAPYRTERVIVQLSDADRDAYDEATATWRGFINDQGIKLGGKNGFQAFLRATARSKEGRAAFKAWLDSRRMLQAAPAKLRVLVDLLARHRDGRVLIFTSDNATVYDISRRLLVPAITHHTEAKERKQLLLAFASGELPVLATSRVLNEGVDIPAADVAIVLSGSGTVREHVQRLGRILRPHEGKQAVLYELVVGSTPEEHTSRRRREHVAYAESDAREVNVPHAED